MICNQPALKSNPLTWRWSKKESYSIKYGQQKTKELFSLLRLLDNKDDRLKRLTANDIIDFIIRHKENEDLDKRLTEVEKLLAER